MLKYKIYKFVETADCIRGLQEINDNSYDTFEEAMDMLKILGDDFVDYTIIPFIRL